MPYVAHVTCVFAQGHLSHFLLPILIFHSRQRGLLNRPVLHVNIGLPFMPVFQVVSSVQEFGCDVTSA
jgi:hypothetical protein